MSENARKNRQQRRLQSWKYKRTALSLAVSTLSMSTLAVAQESVVSQGNEKLGQEVEVQENAVNNAAQITQTIQQAAEQTTKQTTKKITEQADANSTETQLAQRQSSDMTPDDTQDVAQAKNVVDLGTTTVVGKREEMGDGEVYGVAASRSTTGTGTDTKIEEIPQSISVISSQEMAKLGAKGAKQALSYTSGVDVANLGDTTNERVYIRGFSTNGKSLTNGRKQRSFYWTGTTEPFSLERVEVLKGPSSVLYGEGSPGGVVNNITKQAQFDDFAELQVSLGNFDYQQVAADLNTELSDAVALRVIGLFRDANTSIKHRKDDRNYVSANLKWQATETTEVSLRGEYQEDLTQYSWPLPPIGTILPSRWGSLPVNTYLGNPDTDKYDKSNYAVSLDLTHDFTDNLTLKQGLSYFESDGSFDFSSFYADIRPEFSQEEKENASRLQNIGKIEREENANTIAANAKLTYEWGYDLAENTRIENTTLLGLDFSDSNLVQYGLEAAASVSTQQLDIYVPDYDSITGFTLFPAAWSTDTNTRSFGALLQNQTKIDDKWVATLGARYDALEATADLVNVESQRFEGLDEENVSLRAGLVYVADNGIAPYASYSESFEPVTRASRTGLLKPLLGEQIELGVRYAPEGFDTLLSAAAYQITELNSPVPDTNPLFYVQIPEINITGFELEAKTKLGEDATLTMSYSKNESEMVDTTGLERLKLNKGDPKPYVSEEMASLFVTSKLGIIGQPDVEVGVGVKYLGEATTNVIADDSLIDPKRPAYTLVDAMASYEYEDWRFSVNVNNLLDKKYLAGCTLTCNYGPSREVRGTISYRW